MAKLKLNTIINFIPDSFSHYSCYFLQWLSLYFTTIMNLIIMYAAQWLS